MDEFYLISTELRKSFKPRRCDVIARLSNGTRDDLALVDVKPALPAKMYDTPHDITRLIVISREENTSPFAIGARARADGAACGLPEGASCGAVYVYICLPLKEKIDPKEVLAESEYRILDWGSVYRSKDEAAAFTKLLTSYRHGMSYPEEEKHRRFMATVAAAVLFCGIGLGLFVFYTLRLVDKQFNSIQKNISIARQDVRYMVEQAIDDRSSGTETTALVKEIKQLNTQLEALGREIEEVKYQLETQPQESVQDGVESLEEEAAVAPAAGQAVDESPQPQEQVVEPVATEPVETAPAAEAVDPAAVVPVQEEQTVSGQAQTAQAVTGEIVVEEVLEEVPPESAPEKKEDTTLADAIAAVTREVVTNQ